MANKWTAKLRKLEGALTEDVDVHRDGAVMRTPFPSVNAIFGNGWGLPRGYSMLLWGPYKGGKSLLSHAMVGHLHLTDPEAVVVKFDTEMRTKAQLTPAIKKAYGVDSDRLVTFEVNSPSKVFDRIQGDIGGMLAEGMPLKLLIIDSISGVQGRRESGSESIDNQQRGDHALTVQVGLSRILETIRHHEIATILTAHARAEMDPWKVKKGMPTRAGVSFGVQHFAEYFVYAEKNETKDGQKDELGREFRDANKQDVTGEAEVTGHKIRVWMQDSSLGPKNRSGECTIDYVKGPVNVHEEIFRLGTKWGVISRPNATTYTYGEAKWIGKAACLAALSKDGVLQNCIVKDMMAMDAAGRGLKATEEDVARTFRGEAE